MTEKIDGSINELFLIEDVELLSQSAIESRRAAFVQRIRTYLKNAIINRPGPLSNEELWIAAEERSFDFLDNAICYKNHPLYHQLLKVATEKAVEDVPWKIIENAYLYDGQPWAEEFILLAAIKSPMLAIDFVFRIKSEELRTKVLAKARGSLSKNPNR